MRMLIVDDSQFLRRFIRLQTEPLAFEVEEASDGLEALALLEESAFDVALVDWDMPRMNGIELVKAVRERPEFDSMKILMVTAQTGYGSVIDALTKGADDYLMKPVTREMIVEKLRIIGIIE